MEIEFFLRQGANETVLGFPLAPLLEAIEFSRALFASYRDPTRASSTEEEL